MSAKTFDDWLVEIGLEKTAEEKGRKEGRKEGIEKGIKKDRRDVLNILNNCRDLEEAKKKLMSMGV